MIKELVKDVSPVGKACIRTFKKWRKSSVPFTDVEWYIIGLLLRGDQFAISLFKTSPFAKYTTLDLIKCDKKLLRDFGFWAKLKLSYYNKYKYCRTFFGDVKKTSKSLAGRLVWYGLNKDFSWSDYGKVVKYAKDYYNRIDTLPECQKIKEEQKQIQQKQEQVRKAMIGYGTMALGLLALLFVFKMLRR